jgi:hypothetical protein
MTELINGTASLEGSSSLALPLDMLGVRTGAFIDSVATELREQIAKERTSRVQYERLVEESKARERQMVKALAGLEGSRVTEAKPQPQRPGVKRRDRGARGRDWQPSPEKLIAVWHAVVSFADEHPDGFSVGAVAKATPGMSPEVVMKSMKVFREHELVRPAGKVRGGGIKWRLQPGATAASAVEIRGELTAGGHDGS